MNPLSCFCRLNCRNSMLPFSSCNPTTSHYFTICFYESSVSPHTRPSVKFINNYDISFMHIFGQEFQASNHIKIRHERDVNGKCYNLHPVTQSFYLPAQTKSAFSQRYWIYTKYISDHIDSIPPILQSLTTSNYFTLPIDDSVGMTKMIVLENGFFRSSTQ